MDNFNLFSLNISTLLNSDKAGSLTLSPCSSSIYSVYQNQNQKFKIENVLRMEIL